MSDQARDVRVDTYLDGLMSPEERTRFEAELRSNAGLAQEIELQRLIDQELSEQYAYQEPPGGYVPAPAPIPIQRGRGLPQWVKPLAMAAVVALAVAGLWFGLVRGRVPARAERVVAPNVVYTKLVARGWEPEFVCTDDPAFQAAVEKRVGTPLLLEPDPEITALGWAYNAGFSGKIVGDRTMMLLTNVGKERVLVLMDQLSGDRKLDTEPGSGLNLFRREIGPLVVYEVTPLSEPRVIGKLYDPRGAKPGNK